MLAQISFYLEFILHPETWTLSSDTMGNLYNLIHIVLFIFKQGLLWFVL
jgi:hypothetical protein